MTVLDTHPRRIRLAAIAVLVVLLASGCSSQPGAAATVGGTSIPEQSVLDRTSAYLTEAGSADPTDVANSAGVDLINRQQATDLIRHQLVLLAERDQPAPIAASAINAFISQQNGAEELASTWQVPSSEVNDLARDLLVLEKLVGDGQNRTFTDVTIGVDLMTFDSRDAAVAARTKYLAHPATMAADIAAAPDNGQAGGSLQFSTRPDLASFGLFSVPAGSIIIVPQQSGYVVARVTSRAEKQTALTSDLVFGQQSAAGQLGLASLVLAPYEAKAGVTLNPRFGQWDSATLQAVPDNDGL